MGGLIQDVGEGLGILPDQDKILKPIKNAAPVGFTSSGLSADVSKSGVTLTQSPLLQQLLQNTQSAFSQQATQLGGTLSGVQGLLDQVKPGFGALSDAARQALSNQRSRTVGNLRESLARRRVGGSSFAADTIARAESEFAQQEAGILAQTKIQEIAATQQLLQQQAQLISQQAGAKANEFATQINQLNLESQIAAGLSTNTSSLVQQNAALQSQLISNAESQLGELLATGTGVAVGAGAFSSPPAPTGNSLSASPNTFLASSAG